MLCHLGAISLKNLTKCKEVRKGADQANCHLAHDKSLETCKRGHSLLFSYHQAISSSRSLAKFFFYLTSWVFLPPAEIHIELGLMNLIDLNEKTVSVLFKIEKRNGDKRSAACTIIKSIYLKIWIYTKCIKWLPYIGRCNNTIFYFKLFDVGLQCKFIRTSIDRSVLLFMAVEKMKYYVPIFVSNDR